MIKSASIIWLTGMSGSGKSTLASSLESFLLENDYTVRTIDGDDVRDNDSKKLGFGYEDVMKNNLRIASLCNKLRKEYDFILVPVISPYDQVRTQVRLMLEPNFYLVYLKVDIETLKKRDTKGLYSAADKGLISDLIGYSEVNPYDIPDNPEVVVDTGSIVSIEASKGQLIDYFSRRSRCRKRRY